MASNGSFVLYTSYAEHLDQLTDAEAGQLLRAIFDHMDPEKPEPTLQPGAVAMAYSFIRAQIDRDRQAYEDKCEKNRQTAIEAAAKRAERKQTNSGERQRTQANANKRQHNDNDNDNDNDLLTKSHSSPAEPDDAAEKSEPAAKKTTLQDERFDEFWAAYPKKVGKGDARKSWKRIKPKTELFEKIMAAVAEQKNSDNWVRGYIPNPATWLNQERWDDEVKAATPQQSRSSPQGNGQRFDAGGYLRQKLAGYEGG
jgi:hypothetical protein